MPSFNDIRHRRLFGLIFGAALGFAYGLVSQYINVLYLPGVPLYQPPFGPLANTLVWSAVCALLGLISAWPAEGVAGVLISSLLGAVLFWGIALAMDPAGSKLQTLRLIAALVFLVPMVGMLVPLLGLHRWVTGREVDGWFSHAPFWQRAWVPLVLLLVAGGAGLTSRFGPVARTQLAAFHAMVQAGLGAPDEASLPAPLQHELVGGFKANAVSGYTLVWEWDRVNRFGIPRRYAGSPEEGAGIARFDNGWSLVCIYPTLDIEPSCRGFQGSLP